MAPLKFAPEVFQVELAQWINCGLDPDDDLLAAILRNDLGRVMAMTRGNVAAEWRLIHATLVWLWNFAPEKSYGGPGIVAEWRQAHERAAKVREKTQ